MLPATRHDLHSNSTEIRVFSMFSICFNVFPTYFGGRIDVDFEPTCRRECWFDKAGWTHGFKFHLRGFGTFQKSHYRAIGEEGHDDCI